MARVHFSLETTLPFSAQETWRTLTDWRDHGRWIPLTRVWVTKAAAGAGLEFVARSGIGIFALNDRMRVTISNPTELHAEVEKFGRPLTGTAGFRISELPNASKLEWYEDIEVEYVPAFLAKPLTFMTQAMFKFAIANLARRGLNDKKARSVSASAYGQQLQTMPELFGLNILVLPATDLKPIVLREFAQSALQAASRTLVTEAILDYQIIGDATELHIQIRTADRLTAHGLLDEIQPRTQQNRLQSMGGNLLTARNRFGTIDLVAIAPNREE